MRGRRIFKGIPRALVRIPEARYRTTSKIELSMRQQATLESRESAMASLEAEE
jgi:hypothetical protein